MLSPANTKSLPRLWAQYITVSMFNIGAAATAYAPLNYATKPLLMPLLIVIFWLTVRPVPRSWTFGILMGLTFSLFGDIALMFMGDRAFMAGLIAFLIAHVSYFMAFWYYSVEQRSTMPNVRGNFPRRWWWLLPFVALWVGLNTWLAPSLHELQIPVGVYSLAICFMAAYAVHIQPLTQGRGRVLLVGVLLFMASDMIIALTKFAPAYAPPMPTVWIMLLYIVGQALIVRGVIRVVSSSSMLQHDLT